MLAPSPPHACHVGWTSFPTSLPLVPAPVRWAPTQCSVLGLHDELSVGRSSRWVLGRPLTLRSRPVGLTASPGVAVTLAQEGRVSALHLSAAGRNSPWQLETGHSGCLRRRNQQAP